MPAWRPYAFPGHSRASKLAASSSALLNPAARCTERCGVSSRILICVPTAESQGNQNQRLICNMGRRALTLAKEMDGRVCDAAPLARRTARSLWGFRNRLMQTFLTDDARAGCRGSPTISQTVCAPARRRSMRRMWPGISNSSCVFQENIMFRACGRVRGVQEIRDAD